MKARGFAVWIEERRWLSAAADTLQPAVRRAFDGLGPARRAVKNALHGTWLGHPLHPALTDVPLGAWTATVLLDIQANGDGRSGAARAADATLALGLAGAVGAAVTGLTDWSETDGRARQVGMAHAVLNASATLLLAGSLACRRVGHRELGRGLALGGYLIAVAAAYLGGKLAFDERVGVNHATGRELPPDFTPVMVASALQEGQLQRAEYRQTSLLVVKRGERVHALVDSCAHQGGPLSEGKLEGDTVVCPWHGSRFCLESGDVVDGPSVYPQPCLEARIRDGAVEVRSRRD